MFRKACLFAFAGLAASTVLACSSGDYAVGTSQTQEELKKKKGGGATGDGQTCNLDGIDWGGGTSSSPTVGASASPGSDGTAPNDPVVGTAGQPAGNNGGYPVGAVFPSPDGCHTCKCAPDGVWCTVGPCNGGTGGNGCNVDGTIYPPGAAVPSPDGCNTCGCEPDGQVVCTARACAQPTCVYNGKTYTTGESFPSADGCNTCGCMDDGNVACTKKACAN